MTIVAEPMSEEAVADHTKQALANEDVVLRALRDHPGGHWRRLPATPDGWMAMTSPRSGGCNGRSPRSLDDKLIQQPRKGAPWALTDKGEKALDKDNL